MTEQQVSSVESNGANSGRTHGSDLRNTLVGLQRRITAPLTSALTQRGFYREFESVKPFIEEIFDIKLEGPSKPRIILAGSTETRYNTYKGNWELCFSLFSVVRSESYKKGDMGHELAHFALFVGPMWLNEKRLHEAYGGFWDKNGYYNFRDPEEGIADFIQSLISIRDKGMAITYENVIWHMKKILKTRLREYSSRDKVDEVLDGALRMISDKPRTWEGNKGYRKFIKEVHISKNTGFVSWLLGPEAEDHGEHLYGPFYVAACFSARFSKHDSINVGEINSFLRSVVCGAALTDSLVAN